MSIVKSALWSTRFLSIAAALLIVSSWFGAAQATPLAVNPDLKAVGKGLSLAHGGVGLEDLHTVGIKELSINIPGKVRKALLYWTTRNFGGNCPGGDCELATGDQVLKLNGNTITGVKVGRELDNIGYRVDVTSIVQALGTGPKVFTIEDGDPANNATILNGAGLLVFYKNPSETNRYRVLVAEGLDFAYGPICFGDDCDPGPGASQFTEPVDFNFRPKAATRAGTVVIFAGDGRDFRPDRIDITVNGGTTEFADQLNGADGESWDRPELGIVVPAGATQVSVEIVSPTGGDNPDSPLWVMGALRIPVKKKDFDHRDKCSDKENKSGKHFGKKGHDTKGDKHECRDRDKDKDKKDKDKDKHKEKGKDKKDEQKDKGKDKDDDKKKSNSKDKDDKDDKKDKKK